MPKLPLAVLLLAFLVEPAPAADTAKQEQEKLQGNWTVTAYTASGKKAEAKEFAAWRLIVSGNEMTARDGIDLLSAYVFKLDPSATPRLIDLDVTSGPDKDKKVLGLYKLEGETLTVCVAEPDKPRPTAFASKEGSGHLLFVFKREKK
jgi:uncharacterized protein (TIGR03067 family)